MSISAFFAGLATTHAQDRLWKVMAVGDSITEISPLHNIGVHPPPTLTLLGTADPLIPIGSKPVPPPSPTSPIKPSATTHGIHSAP